MTAEIKLLEPRKRTRTCLLRKISVLAEEALRASPYVELRAVECDMEDGILVLRGRVRSFFMKQMAQTIVAKLSLTDRLANLLEVEERAQSHGNEERKKDIRGKATSVT